MATRDCPSEETTLSLLDGELQGDEAKAARAHVDACELCRGIEKALPRVDAGLEKLASAPGPSRDRVKKMLAEAQEAAKEAIAERAARRRLLIILMMVVLALGVAFAVVYTAFKSPPARDGRDPGTAPLGTTGSGK